MRLLQSLSILLGVAAIDGVSATKCPVADTSIVKSEGNSVGKTIRYQGDSFARAGYITVAPDLFDGDPAPEDLNAPGFNITEFLRKHGPQSADPKIETAIGYLRSELGAKKVAATGYCYGGKYSIRFLGKKEGADLGFAAHPSLLEDDEISAIKGPASVAASEMDALMSAERRHAIERLLMETGMAYQVSLYSGTEHGFAVRANMSDPKQKFGKETAFLQAVRWFEGWSS
ncbi:hypothetical protein K4F52_009637 [Lecanicillium sp. MT-2017a]|nr:hypothetical protein K4F52_009637 [Lecanicillium sp. MT-2017a]